MSRLNLARHACTFVSATLHAHKRVEREGVKQISRPPRARRLEYSSRRRATPPKKERERERERGSPTPCARARQKKKNVTRRLGIVVRLGGGRVVGGVQCVAGHDEVWKVPGRDARARVSTTLRALQATEADPRRDRIPQCVSRHERRWVWIWGDSTKTFNPPLTHIRRSTPGV